MNFGAMSHVWLYQSGIDPEAIGVDGEPVWRSLAALLENAYAEGGHNAALRIMKPEPPAAWRPEAPAVFAVQEPDTGKYPSGELEKALTIAASTAGDK